jgi:hypothetical protein
MRVVLTLSVLAAVALWTIGPADARKGARAAKPKAQVARQMAAPESDSDCIRARGVDPGGDYDNYPCWAQWAFGPKRQSR